MLNIDKKVLIHFCTNGISVYMLKDDKLALSNNECISFEESYLNGFLFEKIDMALEKLAQYSNDVNNESVGLYATGIFQKLTQEEQAKLIIHIYVNYGLYFNIVQPDLEQFYMQKSQSTYSYENMMQGLIIQEFRKVVVCGSFQQHLQDIGDVMRVLQKRNILVLSPWTTKVVLETLGTDFILLEGQESLKNERDAWRHKYEHMEKFKQSDAVIICNPNGLVGKGTMFEFGFMVANLKRIIFTERPKELSIKFPYEVGLNFS